MLQFVYNSQFDAMTFELDAQSHFSAGITSAYISPTSADAPGGSRNSYLSNSSLGSFCHSKPPKPDQQFRLVQHMSVRLLPDFKRRVS
jgi:hypothetical protein